MKLIDRFVYFVRSVFRLTAFAFRLVLVLLYSSSRRAISIA